jgi:hypothetical protein
MNSIAPIVRSVCLASVCLLVAYAEAFTQEKRRQSMVPENKTEPSSTEPSGSIAALFPFHPLTEWVGQRFIFLPGPKASAESNYEDFLSKALRKQYQGRIAKVISVSELGGRVTVDFEMEDDRERLRARTLPNKETIKGMTLVDDLETARKMWAGKTVWCKRMMLATYDEQNDLAGNIRVKRYSPLKVVDIVPGWDEEKPVRFLLESTDGKRGFVDLNLSGTNVFQEVRHLHRFENCLLTEDPRRINKWPANTWSLIENSKIIPGMTMEQVKMSWGEPEKITRTAAGENWIYQASTLTFKNGTLAEMK